MTMSVPPDPFLSTQNPLETPCTTHTSLAQKRRRDQSAKKMGKKEKRLKKYTKEDSKKNQEEILSTLEDFTLKENWDQFFALRGSDDSFEWYAEWPQLQPILTKNLLFSSDSEGAPLPAVEASELSILVPGCGNSRLSEHLYDAGFTNITNIDFSKVVISDMLRRNVRERPKMKWRVMDMTSMQFENERFGAIVDKGGLDALMEPKHGPRLGNLYLSEAKRLLNSGGRYICLTLAEPHVLDLLFPKFRFGWKMSVYNVAQESSSSNPKLQTFMVVAEKDISAAVSKISSFMGVCSVESHGYQVCGLYEALERENAVRSEYLSSSDILYSIDDLNLGAKGDLTVLEPGRRVKLILGDPGLARFFYKGVLLDAQEDHGPFSYYFSVFLVPKLRVHEWLFSSEEGQWLIVASSKAARLVMVLLDSSNSNVSMDDIQMDLSPLVKQLAPAACDDGVPIPYMTASDGINHRNIVHEVVSPLTGPIVIDDVMYEKINDVLNPDMPTKDLMFRRLIFQRAESLVQSEAVLSTEGPNGTGEVDKVKLQAGPASRKKGKQKKPDLCTPGSHEEAPSGGKKVNHNYLASSYHNGIISGLMLLSLHLKGSISEQGTVKTVIIGLGAGLLPMFMKICLPTLDIEAIELDPVVLDVAREYFGFREDDQLKVHITDGIKFVEDKAASGSDGQGSCIDILIIDVDSSDSTSGLTCPATDFVEETFLMKVKTTLSEEGLFIINLVSRSPTVKGGVYSRLKKVFSNLFSLQLEEDVNEVIFAQKTDSPIEEDQLSEACNVLVRSLELEKPEWRQRIIDASKLIKPLQK